MPYGKLGQVPIGGFRCLIDWKIAQIL